MKKMERIKVSERTDELRDKKRMISQMVEEGNELATLYRDLGIGEFTAETLADAYNGDYSKVKQLYREKLIKEADGFHSVSIRNALREEADVFNNPYTQKINELRRAYVDKNSQRQLVKYLTVTDDGKVVFTDDGARRLADDTAVWIDSPDEAGKYRQHVEIIRLLNEFFGGDVPLGWQNLFPLWNGAFTMPERGVNYGFLMRKTKQPEQPEQVEQDDEQAVGVIERDNTPTVDKPEPKRTNRKKHGVAKGISKASDYIDRGAEERFGNRRKKDEQ